MEKDIKNIGTDIPNLDEEALILANEICEKQFEIMELQKKQLIIQEYKNSTDMKLVEFAEKALHEGNMSDNKSKYEIGEVSQTLATDIESLSGVNVTDYKHVISAGIIRHIIKRHGKNGLQDKSIQNIDDVGRIKYVLNNYDRVVLLDKPNTALVDGRGNPSKTIQYTKRINGNYCIIQALTDTVNKNLNLVTMFIQKAQKKEIQCVLDTKPQANVRNAHTHSLTYSIPQIKTKVKPLNKKDRGDIER